MLTPGLLSILMIIVMQVYNDLNIMAMDVMSISMGWLLVGAIMVSTLSEAKGETMIWLWLTTFVILLTAFLLNSMMKFYIFFELSLIPILILLLSKGSQPERLSASVYFIFYTAALSFPYLVFILFLPYEKMWPYFFMSISVDMFMSLLLLSPFLVKMPVLGLHFWLPKAHVEANTSGSMILAGVLLKLGSYGAVRVSIVLQLFYKVSWFCSMWLILAVLSSMITFFQMDLKKFVAYSSVTHMTFLMTAIVGQNKFIFMVVVLVSLSHGWASLGLFLNVGLMSHTSYSRLLSFMSSEASLHWMLVPLGVLLMSNASLPPFPSFFPELFLVYTILLNSMNQVFLFFLLSISVCYYNAYLFIFSFLKRGLVTESAWMFSSAISLVLLALVLVVSFLWIFFLKNHSR